MAIFEDYSIWIYVLGGLGVLEVLAILFWLNPSYPGRRKILLGVATLGVLAGPAYYYALEVDLTEAAQISVAGMSLASVIGFLAALVSRVSGTGDGSTGRNGRRLRGAQLMRWQALERILKRQKSQLKVGPLSFPLALETRGALLAGAPGSGKTVSINQMLPQFRERYVRGIVFDENGAFLERFYQPGDIILNPLDSRSVEWSPFAEICDIRSDPKLIAASLVPEMDGPNSEWPQFAQQTLSQIIIRLAQDGKTTNADLVHALAAMTIEELGSLLHGTAAARLFSSDAKGMSASVLGVMGSRGAVLEILSPTAGAGSFSLKKWIQGPEDGSWVFITCRDDQAKILEYLIAAWFSIAASAILSLIPNPDRRIVLALDEFASLPKIGGLGHLITKGRKYGAVPILGLQNLSQVRLKYGREEAQTILSSIGTWFCFQAGDGETAEYISEFLGVEEVLRTMKTSGENSQPGSLRTSSSEGTSEQIATPRIVLPSEIKKLPDRTCFIDIRGEFPVAKIEIPKPPEISTAASRFV
ncbi:MAG: type IV secretion system DNA-binding domain-containing protein [Betaproteobacteria bacterium]|nr:type IV secretion system DNA-binding domain-containing protein [Betaproteobacteria bacterium]